MAEERLQKIIAQAGIVSRRKAEELISYGEVTLNGKIAKLGDKADLSKDSIKVQGKLLKNTQDPLYLAFYKPKGVIAMVTEDPEGRQTLSHFLEKVRTRVFPVGRMDYNGEGIMLLTNDGDIAAKIQRLRKLPRIYHVKIKGHPTEEDLGRLKRGAMLEKKRIRPQTVKLFKKLQSKAIVEIVFVGTGALEVKALFERKGFLIEKVTRVQLGHLSIGGLEPGEYRPIHKSEVELLLEDPELVLKLREKREKKEMEKNSKKFRSQRSNKPQRSLKKDLPQAKIAPPRKRTAKA
jgi:23S rRNA pseudouridine2605 synthase